MENAMTETLSKSKKIKILLAYFSGTGNTEKITEVINHTLLTFNADIETYDITLPSNRSEKKDLSIYDAVIFGFPVYSMRAPRVAREWIESLDGNGIKCSVFFTYGGFGVSPAHYFMQQLLAKAGFELVSTAQIPGAHTFNHGGWKALPGRPDDLDFEAVREYTTRTIQRFTGSEIGKLKQFDKPDRDEADFDEFEKYRFNIVTHGPSRDDRDCSMCGICEQVCPVQAMDAEAGFPDRNKCILCLKCIVNCPENVLQINDMGPGWIKKLELHNMKEEEVNSLRSEMFF